jgi:transposase-like protein
MTKYSNEEKEKWLEEWRGSGKSPWTYAKENGIRPQTFTTWVKKEKKVPGFVEIHPEAGRGTPAAQGEILIERGGLRIRLPSNTGIREVCAVVECVGGLV